MKGNRDERRALMDRVAGFIQSGGDPPASEAAFEELALEVFAFQFRHIEPYQRYCRRLNRTPATVRGWRDIPAVSARVFKHLSLFAGGHAARTFLSSGTSDPRRASRAHFSEAGLALMRVAIEANAARHLFADGARPRILVLAPDPGRAPHAIMAYGMAHIVERFGAAGSGFRVGPEGLELEKLLDELRTANDEGEPLALLGSSFGFVHLFDAMAESGRAVRLAPGSRLMHAGGTKGRSREVGREAFVALAGERLGLPPERVVNLLGMTELASQIYDVFPAAAPEGAARGPVVPLKSPPHWVRTLLFDPRRPEGSGFVARKGESGLLRHFDLANVERPMAIQTEDIGVHMEAGLCRGFEILGRAEGAEPRGCSLTLEELLQPHANSTATA